MSDKPEISGIERDGIGMAKEFLDDPRLKRVLERLNAKIQSVVARTGEKIDDKDAVAAFEKALISTVSEGLKKAVEKD